MYYFREDLGFLHDSVHSDIPEDAHFVPDVYHKFLMEKQQEGDKVISADSEGFPVLRDDYLGAKEAGVLVRGQRNHILVSSDWTQLPDVPEKLKEKYRVYRQALRDVPEQEGFPFDVKWPEVPE